MIDRFPLRTDRDYLIVLTRDMADIQSRLVTMEKQIDSWKYRIAAISGTASTVATALLHWWTSSGSSSAP